MSGGDGWVDLADAVALLRKQLAESQARMVEEGDRGVRFGVGEVTLQLGVELATTGSAEGGLRFGVVSAGGRRESARRSTHQVTIQLHPRRPDGGDVDIGDRE